jgi:hypothetical protein
VFVPFNIDANVNAAYVVIGLLYGKGDFTRTMEISTRCGQDSDCNPSSAGGILGTLLGYNNIPAYWKQGLKEAEPLDFKYTSTSLADVYQTGYQHALEMVKRNGGQGRQGRRDHRRAGARAGEVRKELRGPLPESQNRHQPGPQRRQRRTQL